MPRVNVPVTTITRAGVADATPVTGNPTDNHSVINSDGSVWIEAENTGASSRQVSVLFEDAVDGQTVPAKTYSLAAGARRRIGPFPVRYYGSVLQVDVNHAEVELSAYTLARS